MKDKLVFESLNEFMYEDEAQRFAQSMYDLEAELEELNPEAWGRFEASSGELWRSLNDAQDWKEAFNEDPMACYAMKQELESTIGIF